ncbi:amino acid ABC transporter [Salipiger aestuarii]|uniref:Polar amino acid transport system permease protein n=1 Tax=Salipiger aestuarii TaxID=568098 RepID=A0A327YIW6_9RHOB|nr:amino acid ABC transporter permease [Salipiger aestuarii]EIE51471.1 putative amino acid ABC transporter, permease protein [Citreicella sp. 357]KAA8608909.1 amino acid ABC transporter [Salipiger aestuarii]KAA8613214.1 amino acid ABC transporter [Salipiger aestuarii]KAB2543034.1 amino acid ABC transporter [Salipiger aestuarii]RAK19705.1 polar amino acid transport system permease protein [Salipiger aestuarii]
MSFDFAVILAKLPQILSGLGVTILIWVGGTFAAVVLGFVVATLRRFGGRGIEVILRAPIEILRGTPFLVQIFLLYFGGPYIGLRLDPWLAGLLGISIYGAAYYAEIFRAGFQSVPVGHVEAAECAGLSRNQIITAILLPEMALLVLPPALNMSVILLKETALLSLITVPELTMTVQAIGSQQYAFVESLVILALVYWALVELANWLGRYAERNLSKLSA